MNKDVLFLTETQLCSSSDANEIQTFLDRPSISFNMNDYRFSSLAIRYQKSILLQCHQKDDEISVIKLCKPTYSNDFKGGSYQLFQHSFRIQNFSVILWK